ncbi:MAG: acyl-CoA carboxylase subunit beta [Sulfobacillus sp.]
MERKVLAERQRSIEQGGPGKYHQAAQAQHKLFARARIALLVDQNSWVEDGLFANAEAADLPADGVITGTGAIAGRAVAVMANDSTVKAGSWGARTVEKILRIQETALRLKMPLFYLVDSAGARITDQVEMFPGRRGAGRIFYNQVNMSGVVPQVCLLFGPSAAGGAYIPAFTDITVMVEGNASMYLGSPRMAEMVIGEKVTLEEMGGARMHCTVSGCGDVLVASEEEAISFARRYIGYFPPDCSSLPPLLDAKAPEPGPSIAQIVPVEPAVAFDMRQLILGLIDQDSWCELKALFAPELLCGLARLEGYPVGIVANQPKVKGGVLFVDSADKAARFIALCDAFSIPLVFLADVPGFMIGTQVERQGIIRHGAKMIAALSEATVPKLSVVIRKAYGAGLYAMAGPAFEPEAVLALPTAEIAVMGPEAAVNAVYSKHIEAIADPTERLAFVAAKRQEYRQDIDIMRLASELVIDQVVDPDALRHELGLRLQRSFGAERERTKRRRSVYPV